MINSRRVFAVLVFGALLLVGSVTLTGFAASGDGERVGCCHCCPPGHDYCPPRYSSFSTDQDVYQPGQNVVISLNNLTDFDYWIEKLEIKHKVIGLSEYETVFSRTDLANLDPSASSWSFSWDQTDNNGNPVKAGRFMVKLKTGCCGYYRTYFNVHLTAPCPPKKRCCRVRCCPSCADLRTDQKLYKTGQPIDVMFSACNDCQRTLTRVKVEKSQFPDSRHYVEVYEKEFPDGISTTNWTWTWDQINQSGQQVEAGVYQVTVSMQCCGTVKTCFKIMRTQPCPRPCYRPCERTCSSSCQGTCFSPCRRTFFWNLFRPCRSGCCNTCN